MTLRVAEHRLCVVVSRELVTVVTVKCSLTSILVVPRIHLVDTDTVFDR